jgi:GTPase
MILLDDEEKLKVRKGMVLSSFLPEATWSFEAEVWPLSGQSVDVS